ncbi:AsmA-like C-terminal domain-containing protein [Roseiarcus fermentans]|nr:AsmA-like C-terminal domain-containing protein [Roseiarcus fermentans]
MTDSAGGARLPPCGRTSVRLRRVRHVVIHVLEAMVVVALAAVALVAYRLSSGPITVEWLRDSIATSLQERVGNRYSVELGPTYVMHDSWGLGLGFHNLRLKDREGRTVVSAPSGQIGVDPFVAFLGEVRVRRLELDDLGLRLRVDPAGALSFAAAADEQAATIALPTGGSGLESLNVAALVRAGADAMAGASQALDRLTLANARFEIDNEATGRKVIYRDFNLVFDRGTDEGRARIAATGPNGRWTMEARAATGDRPELSLEARDISLADLETFDKKQPPVFAEGPVTFRLESRLAGDGTLDVLTGRFTLGAGTVRLNNPDAAPFLIDEASGAVAWRRDRKRLEIENFAVLAGETHVAASGFVAPPAEPGAPWLARLEAKNARFGPERRGEKAVRLDSIVAQMRFLPLEQRFLVDNVTAKGPTFDGALAAEVVPDGQGVRLKLRLDLRPSVTQDAIRLWPQFINPDVRDWASHNMHGGQIQGVMVADWSAADLDAMDHKRAVAPDSVHGSFSTRNVGLDLMPGLPTMLSGSGSGSFTGHEFKVAADSATMDLTPARRIVADGLAFEIPDTTPRPIVDAVARAHLAGTADSLADLLTREPLRKQAGLAIDPALVKGQAQGDLRLDLKLGKTARPEDSQFHALGSLTDLTLDKFVGPEKLDQGALSFAADRTSLILSGDGQVFGSPAHLDASRAPGDDGSAIVTATLDQAARVKRGLNLGWLTGPLPITLRAPLSRASAEVDIDLTPAGIDNPIPGVSKPAGKPGKASFQIKPSAEGAAVSNLAVDFGSASLRGSADVAVDGAIQSARFTQARLSPGDNLQAEVVNGAGAIRATVRGSTLDARPLIKSITDQGSTSQPDGKDFDLDMKVANVTGANRQAISGLDLIFSRRGGDDRLASLKGRIGQGTLAAGRGQDGVLRLTTSDAGALAKFVDLYARLEGGDLDLALETSGAASSGRATVTNFALRDEPAFRRLVSAAPSVPGQAVDPQVARFQKMTIAFARSPGQLDIKDAVIYNQNMGLTTEGTVNFARNSIDLTGTFIPAYSVNNLIGNIPLVGVLLGGGQNEGVFGITYRAQGSLSEPKLTVNPLSAIAPGILRKILGAVDGTGPRSAAPDDASKVTPSSRR